MQQLIGNIALNLSFLIYLVLYLPQVIYNLRRKSTDGLSFLMHVILIVGYIADMMYGFGRHMQWQYCLIALIGLVCLGFQHVQIGCYQKLTRHYVIVTLILLACLSYALYAISSRSLAISAYIDAGYVAWGTGIIYILPQVWKNYRVASAVGVSTVFILFDILASLCDAVSAWCLHWDAPSKFGSPIECIFGLLLLAQAYYFKRAKRNSVMTAVSA